MKRKPRNYWTKEKCIIESKKYNSRKEFDKKSRGAYSASLKNGWLEDFTWLNDKRTNNIKDKIDCVYKYYFKETNSIYIGRTIRKRDRDWQHVFNIEKDTVAKYAHENNFNVPSMEIIENNLTVKEGQEKEKYWIEYYTNKGYNILNKAKAGSLGTIARGKWNYLNCFNEAKKYKIFNDFKTKSLGAYNCSVKNNWINDYTWLKIKRTTKKRIEREEISKEECLEKAKECKTLTEYKVKYHKYYNASLYYNCIKEYDWFKTHKGNNYWNYDKCLKIAKQYKTKKEFHEAYPYLYEISIKNKWLETFTWLTQEHKINGYWTFEKCYNAAKKYKTFNEFKRNEGGAAYRARVNGWVNNYTWFKLNNK
jgi:hypothetical protein